MRRVSKYLARLSVARLSLAGLSSAAIVYIFLTEGLTEAAQIAAIIAALVAIVALFGSGRVSRGRVDASIPDIMSSVQDYWKNQERRRGLDRQRFVPFRIEIDGGRQRNLDADKFLQAPARAPLWDLDDMRKVCGRAVYQFKEARSIVVGEAGTGKSTLALAMTLGLIDLFDPQRGRKLVPVTLSLGSWDSRTRFDSWINRRLESTYPALSAVERSEEGGVARALVNSERFVFILDGLDEIDAKDRQGALAAIAEFFPESQRLCVLGRASGELGGATMLTLRGADLTSVKSYLQRFADDYEIASLGNVLAELERNPAGHLARLLQIPLYLRLTCEALRGESLSAESIVDAAGQDDGPDRLKRELLRDDIRRSMEKVSKILQARNARRCLETVARHGPTFEWWHLAEEIPRGVLVTISSLLVTVPAYLLATVMPVGLTRGLAIGACAGALFGLLRGSVIGARFAVLGAVLSWAAVALLGYWIIGWGQAIADATEIALSVLLVLFAKEQFLSRRYRFTAVTLLVSGAVVAGATELISWAVGFVDSYRGFLSISLAVAGGIGVAIIAAHLLMPEPRDAMQASRITLVFEARTYPVIQPLWSAILAASLIGLVGGLVGGMRFGSDYAVSLILFFGLTIGVPVGVAGGLIKWLSFPLARNFVSAASRSDPPRGAPLRSDRIVAIFSIVFLSAMAALSIFAFTSDVLAPQFAVIRDFNPPGFTLQPGHGLLYGLTMGIVVACFFTAWPSYFIAHLWLVVRGVYPWRLMTFLEAFVAVEILRSEGSSLHFRHAAMRDYLADPQANVGEPPT